MSKSIKVLVFSAMCIALASVTSMIKVFEFPTGGSITLASTFFATLPGFFFGPAVGIAAGCSRLFRASSSALQWGLRQDSPTGSFSSSLVPIF